MTRVNKGFSLIELLIVVAIILIIAAIAVPALLSSRMAANEASAVGSLNAIKTAEYAYTGTFPTIGYAANIAALGGTGTVPCSASSAAACLLDGAVVAAVPGGTSKSGYVFLATGIPSGGTNTSFVAGASPVAANKTGNRDFCSTDDGVLRSQLATTGDLPVTVTNTCFTFPVSQ